LGGLRFRTHADSPFLESRALAERDCSVSRSHPHSGSRKAIGPSWTSFFFARRTIFFGSAPSARHQRGAYPRGEGAFGSEERASRRKEDAFGSEEGSFARKEGSFGSEEGSFDSEEGSFA